MIKDRDPILDPQRMQLVEYGRQDWVATVEEGLTLKQVMDPGFWANTSALMITMIRRSARVGN